MRTLTCGIILAFLFTATHVLIDHGAGGHQPFALLPHPSPSHTHSDAGSSAAHHDHDHEGEPCAPHAPDHHQAETHSHFVWYIPAEGKILQHLAASVLAATLVVCPSLANSSALHGSPPAPPPRELALSPQRSVLRI